jgi:hypothetical protein
MSLRPRGCVYARQRTIRLSRGFHPELKFLDFWPNRRADGTSRQLSRWGEVFEIPLKSASIRMVFDRSSSIRDISMCREDINGGQNAAHEIAAAFEAAWRTLSGTRRPLNSQAASNARIRLAHIILELAHRGERDASRLHDLAIEALDSPVAGRALLPQL